MLSESDAENTLRREFTSVEVTASHNYDVWRVRLYDARRDLDFNIEVSQYDMYMGMVWRRVLEEAQTHGVLLGRHREEVNWKEMMVAQFDPRTRSLWDESRYKKEVEGEWIGVDISKTEEVEDDTPSKGEAIMGFGTKKRALPEDIKTLDFEDIHSAHDTTLAEWMGVKNATHRAWKEGGKAASRLVLKEACQRDWDRAQQGYDIICLGKKDAGMKKEMSENDVVKALYSTVSGIINEHREELGEVAFKHVSSAVDAMKKSLLTFAKEAIETAADRKAPLVIKDAGKVRKVKGVVPPEFKRMVELASARIPIMLVGPAGCGKTYLCEKLGDALGFEFSDQSCSEGMSESVFNGLLLPVGKGGAFEHVATPFMERYETGGVMLLDEIDAGDPNLFTYINKAIANSSYTVPQRFQKPVVKKHGDFVLVAAANTFGNGSDSMYVGRNQLDAATLDRFKVGLITMDYSSDVEQSLAPQDLCEWAWAIRGKIRQNKLRRVMSTRVIKDLGAMTARYEWKQKDWETAYFAGWSDADRRLVA